MAREIDFKDYDFVNENYQRNRANRQATSNVRSKNRGGVYAKDNRALGTREVRNAKNEKVGNLVTYPKLIKTIRKQLKRHQFRNGVIVGSLVTLMALNSAGFIHQPVKEAKVDDITSITAMEDTVRVYTSIDQLGKEITAKYDIKYNVGYGDTLLGIAGKVYPDDINRQYDYVDKIVSDNGLRDKNSLRAGSTLKLSVPEEGLGEFGYEISYDSEVYKLNSLQSYITSYEYLVSQLDESLANDYIVQTFATLTTEYDEIYAKYQNEIDTDIKEVYLEQLNAINEKRVQLIEQASARVVNSSTIPYKAPVARK